VGPFSRIAEALPVAKSDDLEAAVLDINLNGELVYPVAEALVTRGVPVVFVTGYGAESIDDRFAEVPVLQKPIERQVLESFFAVKANSSLQPDLRRGGSDSRVAVATNGGRAVRTM
jgi:CheY-like chemotaxis protein